MSSIDKLIAELCPEGVEFKELWEITAWDKKFNGLERYMQKKIINYPYVLANKFKELELEHGNFRLLSTGNYIGWTSDELAGENLCKGEIVAIPWGGKANVKYYKGKFVTADNRIATSIDTEILMNKFLYYCMLEEIELIESFYRGAGIKHPSMRSVLKMKIPLPPLPIQQEIVSILDSFTELDAELQAELEARKKQYEYYREQLLNFEGKEVEWKTLGEVCLKTSKINWKEIENTDYLYIDLTSVNRDNNKITDGQIINSTNAPSRAQQIVLKDDVIFGTTRPTLKRVSIIPEIYHKQVCSTGFCVLRANQEKVLSKYIYYILMTPGFYSFIEINQEGASYPSISDKKIKEFSIPIPPLSEQERIVSILDKFEALVNVELPAEIAARRKQYEYYREKLLTFEPFVK